MNLDHILNKLKSGQQLGKQFQFDEGSEKIWSAIAIQLWEGRYKVGWYEIAESKMAADDFRFDRVISFNTLEEATEFVAKNTPFTVADFRPFKGQRVFNPRFDTE
ncbi:MAG: hypothetical protein AAF998_24600 [Bacteroidota bacterium]